MVWPLSPTVLHKQTSLTAHFSLLSATLLCVNELNSRSWNYFALSDFYWSTSGLSLLMHVDRAIVIDQIFRVPGIAANYAVDTLSFTSHWWMVTGDAHCVVAIFYLLFARSITWQCHPVLEEFPIIADRIVLHFHGVPTKTSLSCLSWLRWPIYELTIFCIYMFDDWLLLWYSTHLIGPPGAQTMLCYSYHLGHLSCFYLFLKKWSILLLFMAELQSQKKKRKGGMEFVTVNL